MDIVSVNVNEISWQPAPEYHGDVQKKILCSGDDLEPRTILLKIPPGWSMDAHSHRLAELHYVLEGGYSSEGRFFGVGSFRMIPKEVDHGPFSTQDGAVVLVIWCALSLL